MGKKMDNAPVYFTLAQIRFNPFLNLAEYLPAIQDKFRACHFSDFRHEQVQQVAFPAPGQLGGQAVPPAVSSQSRYIFGNIAGTANYVLDSNSLVFQTTAYETFEEFSNSFRQGLNIVNDELNLDFVERLGIRYFDAVMPLEGETLADYLVPEVMGTSDFANRLVHSLSETVSLNDHGKLVSRVLIRDGVLGMPSDILPLAPGLPPKLTSFQGRHAIIDSDAYSETRGPIDTTEVLKKLDGLHKEISMSFEKVVTEYALRVWK
jgi:uncharacterized protein (TIGR04255 family)